MEEIKEEVVESTEVLLSSNSAEVKLRPIADIITDLKKPIHPSKLKTRPQGGQTITFIPWFYATQYLDKYAPGWSYTITSSDVIALPEKLEYILKVRLSIPAADGVFHRDALGTGLQEKDMKTGKWRQVYGGAAEIAESAALRRAAAKFGLGLYLYEGD